MFTPSLWPSDLDHVLAHTRDLWGELRGERLFITGGSGFFGMWLIESFLWANEQLDLGAEVLVLSRDPAALLRKAPHLAGQPSLSFQAGSMQRFEFPAGRFSHVIHAATEHYDSPSAIERLSALDRDIQGTRRVLEFARQCGAKRFLFTSSGAVYGRQPAEMTHIPDDYAGSPETMNPNTGYGHAKRISEFLGMMYAQEYGLETKIARCFAFVGPYLPLSLNFAVGNFLRDALAGGPIVVQGDGTPYRSYMYAADLAVWLWTILFRGQSCRAYNVGSDEGLDLADLASRIGRLLGGVGVQIVGAAVAGRSAARYVPSIARARGELHLDILVPLEEAMRRTVRFYGAEPASP